MKNKKLKSFYIKHSVTLILGILFGYILFFVATNLFFRYVLHPQQIKTLTPQLALSVLPQFLFSISFIFGIGIYLFNSWLAKKWIKIELSKVILFMGTLAALGPIGEIIVGNLSRLLLGQPIWIYQLLPVHNGNTSMVMAVLWPIYGFHIYCFHTALKARYRITNDADLSLFVGIDAITIEVLVNLFSLSFFYTYVFYYLAGDLWHLSTAVIFIPYIICGYLGIKILHILEKRHHYIIVGIIGFIVGWLIIFVI